MVNNDLIMANSYDWTAVFSPPPRMMTCCCVSNCISGIDDAKPGSVNGRRPVNGGVVSLPTCVWANILRIFFVFAFPICLIRLFETRID